MIVGFLGYRDIELSAKVLAIALILEALVVIVLDVAIIVQGGEAGLNLSPFAPSEFLSGAVGLGVMFALLGF
ncbi:APC family permease, partial [Acinetobacter baumannii]